MSLRVELRHQQGAFALDLAFEAPAGVTALFGRSGAGKSTVLNAIAGLFTPQSGEISLNGRVLLSSAQGVNLPPHRRQIGTVFQDGRLFPHLSVRQNLAYGRWFAARRAGPEFGQVVALLGLERLLERRPSALSGGEKSRVAIGRALLAKPQMLLMDEPLAALDAARKAEILPYLERLTAELDLPILYVSHALSEVTRLAATMVVIEAGKLCASGPCAEVLAEPALAQMLGLRESHSLLPATLAAQEPDGLSRLQTAGGALFLPQIEAPLGSRLTLSLRAQDILLATAPPQGLSALNILAAEVESLHPQGAQSVVVRLRIGEARVLAQITQRSALALGLQPAQRLYAILKAVAMAQQG